MFILFALNIVSNKLIKNRSTKNVLDDKSLWLLIVAQPVSMTWIEMNGVYLKNALDSTKLVR